MFKHSLVEIASLDRKTEDGKRFYVTPEGERYPSVTTITSQVGKKAIMEWRRRVGEAEANKITSKASRRGTKVHKLCEQYVLNEDIDFKKVIPTNLFMFKQIKPILDKYLNEVYAVECTLYSDYLKVAGQVDCVGLWNGDPAIIDFKTSNKRKPKSWISNYFMQEAAYAVMFEERTGIPITTLVTVIAVEQDEPQMFIVHRDNYIHMFQEYREIFKEKHGV
jgi:genome maintenance exonuclease 1|tara:strand:+ start:7122 stop:7784 length:663 start_codon:yes stop_codon:yes gene_type:complete